MVAWPALVGGLPETDLSPASRGSSLALPANDAPLGRGKDHVAVKTVSFSELDCFRQCPHKWHLAYRELWQPAELGQALARGVLFHEVLAAHYGLQRQGLPPKLWTPTLRKLVNPLLYDETGSQTEIQELVAWMYAGYAAHWGTDPTWKVLAVEQQINHMLPPLRGATPFRLYGTVDLVVREGGFLWLVDHKTHKDLPNERKLEFDDQMGLYIWLLRKMGKPVHGAIYNVARSLRYKDESKQALEDRFARIYLHKSDKEVEEIAREAMLTRARAAAIKTRRQAERNTGEHCTWRCEFTESCLAGRKHGEERETAFMIDKGFSRGEVRYGNSAEHASKEG